MGHDTTDGQCVLRSGYQHDQLSCGHSAAAVLLRRWRRCLNYGGIGAVIGHESSHGFDDQGHQFDGDGNKSNWWTPTDEAQFNARTAKLVQQFNAYTPL